MKCSLFKRIFFEIDKFKVKGKWFCILGFVAVCVLLLFLAISDYKKGVRDEIFLADMGLFLIFLEEIFLCWVGGLIFKGKDLEISKVFKRLNGVITKYFWREEELGKRCNKVVGLYWGIIFFVVISLNSVAEKFHFGPGWGNYFNSSNFNSLRYFLFLWFTYVPERFMRGIITLKFLRRIWEWMVDKGVRDFEKDVIKDVVFGMDSLIFCFLIAWIIFSFFLYRPEMGIFLFFLFVCGMDFFIFKKIVILINFFKISGNFEMVMDRLKVVEEKFTL